MYATVCVCGRLQYLLGHNELAMSEKQVFECALLWSEAECKRKDLNPCDPVDLRRVMDGVIDLIRFPLMSIKEFTGKVVPTEILTEEELLDVYTYIASKKSGAKNVTTRFNAQERMHLSFEFKWARGGTQGIIEPKQKQTFNRTPGTSGYCCVIADTAMPPNSGKYFWAVKVLALSTSDWHCGVGVATQALNMNNYLSSTVAGWAYFNQGCRCHNSGSNSDKYGTRFEVNQTVSCLFDSDAGTLAYFLGDKSFGVAFTGIKETVWPAAQVNSNVILTIVEDPKIPDEVDC